MQTDNFIQDLQDQDPGAFCQLVKQHHARLVALAGSIAGGNLAEDIVQDAWIAVFRGLPKFEARASLKTWLFTIVRNESTTRLRKEGRMPSVSFEEGGASNAVEPWLESSFAADGRWKNGIGQWSLDSPERLLQEQQLRQCIEHTMTLLTADQKTVFQLRDLQQMPLEEICNILELSNSNVRVLLHRARLQLMHVIDRYQETGEC